MKLSDNIALNETALQKYSEIIKKSIKNLKVTTFKSEKKEYPYVFSPLTDIAGVKLGQPNVFSASATLWVYHLFSSFLEFSDDGDICLIGDEKTKGKIIIISEADRGGALLAYEIGKITNLPLYLTTFYHKEAVSDSQGILVSAKTTPDFAVGESLMNAFIDPRLKGYTHYIFVDEMLSSGKTILGIDQGMKSINMKPIAYYLSCEKTNKSGRQNLRKGGLKCPIITLAQFETKEGQEKVKLKEDKNIFYEKI